MGQVGFVAREFAGDQLIPLTPALVQLAPEQRGTLVAPRSPPYKAEVLP